MIFFCRLLYINLLALNVQPVLKAKAIISQAHVSETYCNSCSRTFRPPWMLVLTVDIWWADSSSDGTSLSLSRGLFMVRSLRTMSLSGPHSLVPKHPQMLLWPPTKRWRSEICLILKIRRSCGKLPHREEKGLRHDSYSEADRCFRKSWMKTLIKNRDKWTRIAKHFMYSWWG